VHNGLLAPVIFLIIIGLSLDKSLLTKVLSGNSFVLLGNASYSIYILQWPIFIIFTKLVNKSSLDGIYFYIYLISLIIISIIVYLFFEKNMKQFILKKLIKK
jgi:peptidoglycan/LPS O-acetylase OafA/YrhL